MLVTIDIPEELATRIRPLEDELPKILELGLRELQAAAQAGFKGVGEVLETLATLPSAEEVLKLRPSPALQSRIEVLLEKNQGEGLTADEENEWEHYEYLEHLVRMAKAKALLNLKKTPMADG